MANYKNYKEISVGEKKMKEKIIVLMSTYNGERYLEEQLQSIINQKFEGNIRCRVELLVRDDGSKDGTVGILKKYEEKGLLHYYTGENIGFQKSFWDLLRQADDADYYAFSDQDDVWFEDKLSRAVNRLSYEESENIPLLYCSAVVRVDKELHSLNDDVVYEKSASDFPHLIMESVLTQGCTCVFNCKARQYMAEYNMEKYSDMKWGHDELAGKIVSLLGKVVYDEKPGMFYRVHGNNVCARKKENLVQEAILKIKKILAFLFHCGHVRSRVARVLEEIYGDKIADNENARCLHEVAHYRESFRNTVMFLKDRAFRTGGVKHDLFLFIKILVRKI